MFSPLKVLRSHLSAQSIILSHKNLFLLHSQQLFSPQKSSQSTFDISNFHGIQPTAWSTALHFLFLLKYHLEYTEFKQTQDTSTDIATSHNTPPATFQLRDSTTISLPTYFWHTFAYTAIPLLFHPTMLNFGGF